MTPTPLLLRLLNYLALALVGTMAGASIALGMIRMGGRMMGG